jgi:ATP phosphoribosyltransferase
MEYLNIALPKGRIGSLAVELFEECGLDLHEIKDDTRKLILSDEKNKIRFFLVKPSDVPTYVEYGSADIGIVGKDTLMEEDRRLYEVLDLGFGACSLVVAGPVELMGNLEKLNNKRVATKYPRVAREYFEHKKNESIEVIKLNGSVELAPLVGLSEVIVDIVESGKTLKDNGLVILETIAQVSARLVVNRVSFKMKSEKINLLIESLKNVLEKR